MTVSPGDTEEGIRHTTKEKLGPGTLIPTILALGSLNQENDHHELKSSLGHIAKPYPTEAKTEKMKQHAYGKAVWDWRRKRGVSVSQSVGGLAYPRLSSASSCPGEKCPTLCLWPLFHQGTQGCEEILCVQESN